jgi:hypothetical protein
MTGMGGMIKSGEWKLRGIRRRSEKGRCRLCSDEEDVPHIPLKCSETKKFKEQFLSSNKWLNINENVACKITISCINVAELRNTGKYL